MIYILSSYSLAFFSFIQTSHPQFCSTVRPHAWTTLSVGQFYLDDLSNSQEFILFKKKLIAISHINSHKHSLTAIQKPIPLLCTSHSLAPLATEIITIQPLSYEGKGMNKEVDSAHICLMFLSFVVYLSH